MAVRKVQKKKTSNLQKTTSIKSKLANTFRDTDVNVCLFSTDGVYNLNIKESSRRMSDMKEIWSAQEVIFEPRFASQERNGSVGRKKQETEIIGEWKVDPTP